VAFNGKVQKENDEKGKWFAIITKTLRFIPMCAQEILAFTF
jgi:alkyl hydroperoxide reductase subunit AhpC